MLQPVSDVPQQGGSVGTAEGHPERSFRLAPLLEIRKTLTRSARWFICKIVQTNLINLENLKKGGGMNRRVRRESGCGPPNKGAGCCKVESLISVDDRGQMVLPKEVRDKAGIRAGDKLALVSWEKEGRLCCFTLIKVDEFTDMVRDLLGPMLEEMTTKSTSR